MRRATCGWLAGLAAASLLAGACGAAHAQGISVRDVFEKYKLLGTFAMDCSKPPSKSNYYYVNRAIDAGHVQRDRMIGPTARDYATIIDAATPLGPGEISISGMRTEGGLKGQPVRETWTVEPNRQMATEVTVGDNKAVTAGRLADGRAAWWANRCGGAERPAGVDALYRLIVARVDNPAGRTGEWAGQAQAYAASKTPKAIVACLKWGETTSTKFGGAVYLRTGSSATPPASLDVAINEAAAYCVKGGCPREACVTVDRDGQNALQPPAGWSP